MLYMSLDWHGTRRRQVFGCLYHWRRLERVARRQAVEVLVVDMTAFLAAQEPGQYSLRSNAQF